MGLEDLLIEQLANNDTQARVSNSFIQWGGGATSPQGDNRTPERLQFQLQNSGETTWFPIERMSFYCLDIGKNRHCVFQPICTFLPSRGDGQSHQKHPLILHPMESPRLSHCDWTAELDHCGLNTSWENKTFHRRLTRHTWVSFSVVLSLFFVRRSRGVFFVWGLSHEKHVVRG